MKSSTLIVWLLVGACISIDLAMIGELQVRKNNWPDAGGLVGLGLTFPQVTLLALWAVWGQSKIPVRGVSTLLGVWALSCLATFSSTGGLQAAGIWFGVLMFYCCVSLTPFMIVRFAGYVIVNQASQEQQNADNQLSAKQFSIWGILSLMTAIGITLAVVRFAEFPVEQMLEVASFFSLLAVTVCAAMLLSLFLSRVIIAIAATTIICPITGVLLSYARLASDSDGQIELVLMMCVQAVTILSAALVLRSAGYRLVRYKAADVPKASESSDASESGSEGQADAL